MKKKVIITAILILAILVGIRVYYWVKPGSRNGELLRAVPVDAAFFVEINKLSSLDKKLASLPYAGGLKKLPFYKKVNDLLTTVSPLFNHEKEWKSALFDKTIITSFHLTHADNFEALLIVDLNSVGTPDFPLLLKSMGALLSFNERNFMGENVYDVRFNNGKNITVACIDHILIISSESFLVEDGVAQVTGKGSLLESENFVKLQKATSAEFDATVYFNYKQLAEFMGGFASIEAQPLVTSMSNFADWTELDISFQPHAIQFKGNTVASTSNWLNWLNKQDVQNNTVQKVAPDNTAILLQLNGASNDTFITRQNPALNSNPDFQHYMQPWLGSQMALLMVEPVGENFQPQSFLVLAAKDEKKASGLLNDWASVKSGGTVETVNYKGKIITRLNIGDAIDQFYKSTLIHISNPYYVVLDGQVVMSNSVTQLKLLTDKYLDGGTLFKKAGAPGQVSVYFDLAKMKDFFRAMGSDSLDALLPSSFDGIKQFSPLQLTYKAGKDLFSTSGSLNYSGTGTEEMTYLWKTSLDTTAAGAPQVVYSANGQDKMVAVQDLNNQLYLLNKGGDVVWKKMLDAPIMGKIYQLDFYSNGEQQMLFATAGKIYLLKMDGTPVGNYPITLSAKAIGPLSLLDFDGVQQYRFFIACNNGSIYGFEKSGKPMSGWNPNAGVGAVHLPVEFYKAAGKEFIMAITDNGTLLFFNRDGKKVATEIKLKTQFTSSFTLGGNSISNVDTAGTLFKMGMDGKLQQSGLPVDGVVKGIAYEVGDTARAPLNYLLLSHKKLYAFRNDTSLLFKYEFASANPQLLFLMSNVLTQHIAIGAIDTTGKQVYLFDNMGRLYNGFPKAGANGIVLDDLFSNRANVLVTIVNGREVIAYGL